MRRTFGSALLAVCALALGSAPGRGEDKKFNVEGTWVITEMEIGGKALPADLLAKVPEAERVVKITAEKMIATKDGKEDPATYKIDTSKTPYQIDLISKNKDGKEEKVYGIIKLDGDKLYLCGVESDKAADRPKEFKTTEKDKAMLMVFEKKKK